MNDGDEWRPPSIVEASLRLQRLIGLLQQQQLDVQLKRATALLESHLEKAKKDGELGNR